MWYAITETCLAMTMFRDEFDLRFVMLFTVLLAIKLMHWLFQDRIDFVRRPVCCLSHVCFRRWSKALRSTASSTFA